MVETPTPAPHRDQVFRQAKHSERCVPRIHRATRAAELCRRVSPRLSSVPTAEPSLALNAAATPRSSAWLDAARAGSLRALDHLLRRQQQWIFNLALRMVWRREVAEDATQEILLKAVTHLGTFEARSKFSTWLYRIAVNHLLNVRKSEMEERRMTFVEMGQSLDECLDSELPDESQLPNGHGLLVEEAKLGCVTAMLMCLDRRQRLAFVLGEIFGVTSEQGGEMEVIGRQLPAAADSCPAGPLPVHARQVRSREHGQPVPLHEEVRGLYAQWLARPASAPVLCRTPGGGARDCAGSAG